MDTPSGETAEFADWGDWVVLIPSGDLTGATADRFAQHLARLDASDSRNLRIDLRFANRVDAQTLRALLEFTLYAAGGEGARKVEIVNATPEFHDLLKHIGVAALGTVSIQPREAPHGR